MSALLLAALLAQTSAFDGGVDCDTPFVSDVAVLPVPDGGVAVCLDQHTAICNARRIVGAETERDELRASLLRTDPAPLTIAVWATSAAVVTAAAVVGVIAATNHLR